MIGKRIRAIRIRKGLTQKEVANRCGMPDSAIRKYESGTITPKFETMDRIASALDVPVTALMGYVYKGTDENGKDIYDAPDIVDIEIKSEDYLEAKKQILLAFDKLNSEGQQKAVERVEELTEIRKYQK